MSARLSSCLMRAHLSLGDPPPMQRLRWRRLLGAMAVLTSPAALDANAQQAPPSVQVQPPVATTPTAPVVLAQATSPYPGDPGDPNISRLPSVSATNARVTELEQRLADVEAKLNQQQTTAAPEAIPAPSENSSVVGSDLLMIPKWNFGFEAESKDKVFRTKIGGQLQFDYTDFNEASQLEHNPILAGGIGRQNESVNFRRLRLKTEGTMYENVGWVVQPDFANAANVSNVPGNPPGFPANLNQGNFVPGQTLALAPTITDAYVTIMKLPVMGNLRIGNFKEPIGLEHLTSSRFLDFMERSYNQDLFYGPFNNGFMPARCSSTGPRTSATTWALWGGPNQSNLFGYHVGQGQWAGTAPARGCRTMTRPRTAVT